MDNEVIEQQVFDIDDGTRFVGVVGIEEDYVLMEFEGTQDGMKKLSKFGHITHGATGRWILSYDSTKGDMFIGFQNKEVRVTCGYL